MNIFNKSMMALALEESFKRTCVNCGDIDTLCNCGNFQNAEMKYE